MIWNWLWSKDIYTLCRLNIYVFYILLNTFQMANLWMIKGKMKSVWNLKKITRALEVVSTVKLQKIKEQADQQKEYLLDLVHIITTTGSQAELFDVDSDHEDENKTLHIVVTSERGLCWWLNSKLLRKVYADMSDTDEVFALGKKWLEFFKRSNIGIAGSLSVWDKYDEKTLLPLYTFFDQAISSGTYSTINIYFNYFKNSILQIPTAMQIYPFTPEAFDDLVQQIWVDTVTDLTVWNKDLLVEPSLAEFAVEARRQLRNFVLSSTILQNKAWEHASRMIAMKNAKDNAIDIGKKLKQTFNKARQGAITQEISEIVSAKIAIEG